MFTVNVNKKSEVQKPRKIFYPILFVIICFAAVLAWLYVKNQSVVKESSESDEESAFVEVIHYEYFVAQKDFKTFENNITFEELQNSQIACFEEDEEKVKQMLELEEVLLIEGSDIYDWLKENNFDSTVIIPPQKANVRLKTLAIDGIFFWDEDSNLENYSLVYEETQEVREDEVEELEVNNFDYSEVITYVATGEAVPARAVARKFNRTGDYKFPFYDTAELFQTADMSSMVLETSMNGKPEACHGCTWFEGDEGFMEGITYAGIDIVTPGNHFRDGGADDVERTIQILDEANVLHSGFSSTNWDDASAPAVYDINGFKIAFLGYDDVAWFHWAGPTWSGVATVSKRYENGSKELLVDRIKSDVERARSQADFVVVIPSWGDVQYINWPLPYQEQMAHEFLDAGADLIVGTHPHWVSSVEFYNDKLIFYCINNFIFDLTHTDPTRQGVILKFYFFDKKLVSVKILPYQACGPQQSLVDDEDCNHFQPKLLEETDPVYKIIMDRMFEHSEI